jgi:DNA polymerase (family 10)
LNITDVAKLEQAARAGKLRALKGFGAKSEEKILAGIEAQRRKKSQTRILLGVAYPFAQEIVAALRAAAGSAIHNIAPAGSLRRMKPTIGDLDILVASDTPQKIIDAFVALPLVRDINAKGKHQSEHCRAQRFAGGFARPRTETLGERAAIFYREQGTQHRAASDCVGPRFVAE